MMKSIQHFLTALVLGVVILWASVGGAVAQDADEFPITKSDVEAYVAMMFSERNSWPLVRRDGKIHKWSGPIKVHVAWPRCESVAHAAIDEFREKTGINVTFEGGGSWDATTSILILGVKDGDEIRNDKDLYDWIVRYIYLSADKTNEMLDILDKSESFIVYRMIAGVSYDEIKFIQNIITEKWIKADDCNIVYSFLFGEIANASTSYSEDSIVGIDYLYASALYAPSVLNGEDESAAQQKILQLMLNKLERTK